MALAGNEVTHVLSSWTVISASDTLRPVQGRGRLPPIDTGLCNHSQLPTPMMIMADLKLPQTKEIHMKTRVDECF